MNQQDFADDQLAPGDEYRASAKRIASGGPTTREDPVDDWIKRADQAPSSIRARCQGKADKHYGGRASLLVYLNLTEYGVRQKEILESLADSTKPAKDAFEEVWVLWNDRAYPTWKGGVSVQS